MQPAFKSHSISDYNISSSSSYAKSTHSEPSSESEMLSPEPIHTSYESSFISDFRSIINDYPMIPNAAITKMLHSLKKHKYTINEEQIPLDCRTLMKTPRSTHVQLLGSSNEHRENTYFYFGIQRTMLKYKAILLDYKLERINLVVHCDGVEGDKSSDREYWPILAKIVNIDINIIFPIALFSGYGKPPSLEEYLRPFVDEVLQLYKNGVCLDVQLYEFKIVRMLGDAPARCLFLNLIPVNARRSCLQCDVQGESLAHRTHFYLRDHEIDLCQRRTLENFNNVKYKPLQKGRTPLMEIPGFNCLRHCPYDSMHFYHNVIGKLCTYWADVEKSNVRKARSKNYRLSPSYITSISRELLRARRKIPIEFQRQTDSLDRHGKWKATQRRFFLLYVGPVVMKRYLSRKIYRNFLLLNFSIRRLCDPNATHEGIDIVRPYLRRFIHSYAEIYGREVVGHYIHGLLPIPDEVKEHGPFDSYGAFLFESSLGLFKKFIRTGRRPDQQIVNRLIERQVASRELYFKTKRSSNLVSDLDKYSEGPFPSNLWNKEDFEIYSKISLTSCSINTRKSSDNLIKLTGGRIFRVLSILQCKINKTTSFYGYCLPNVRDFYNYPAPSSHVGIYVATEDSGCKNLLETINLMDFQKKMVGFPQGKETIVAIEMLH